MPLFKKKENYSSNNITLSEFVNALSSSNVFSSVIANHPTVQFIANTIADTISTIPLNLYVKNKGGGSSRAVFSPLYDMVRDYPNPYETPSLFFGRVVKDILLEGNAFIKIVRSANGEVLGLQRLPATEVAIEITDVVSYKYKDKPYSFDDIIHIPSKYGTRNTYYGISPLEYCKDAIITSASMRKYLTVYYDNFISAKLHLTVDGNLEQIKLIQDELSRDFISNAGKVFITPKTWEVKPLQLQSNQTAEITDNNEQMTKEIAMAFKFPYELMLPRKENDDAEKFYATFRETTLLPITTLIEEKFKALLLPDDKRTLYFEYDWNNLMRPSITARYANYKTGGGSISFLTPNEIRKSENLPPLPSEIGDTLYYNTSLYQLSKENVEAQNARNKLLINPVENHNPAGDDK